MPDPTIGDPFDSTAEEGGVQGMLEGWSWAFGAAERVVWLRSPEGLALPVPLAVVAALAGSVLMVIAGREAEALSDDHGSPRVPP